MKHIGIAAVTAEGAGLCYQTICREAAKKLGPNKHPEITLHNGSFHKIFDAQVSEKWDDVVALMLQSLEKLKEAGADLAIIPANSTHFVFDKIRKDSPLPLLSIVEVSAEECKAKGYKKVLTLGIGITMSRGLFAPALNKFGIESIVPNKEEQERINTIIFKEIIPGLVTAKGTDELRSIVEKYAKEGCDSVLLGCTELPIVLNPGNVSIPTIDTTRLIAVRALDKALE